MTAVVAALALGACVPVIIPVAGSKSAPVRSISAQAPTDAGFDQRLSALRSKAGVGQLTYNRQLERAATAHAVDMNRRGYFAHKSPEGVRAGARAQAVGVPSCGIGENIAKGQRTSAEAFQGWLNSGPHRRNLENRTMASYGLGRSGDVWVMMLYMPC